MGDVLSQLGGNDGFNLYNQSIEAHQQRRNNLSNEIEALRKAAGITLDSNVGSMSNLNSINGDSNRDNGSELSNSQNNNNFSSGISADYSFASLPIGQGQGQGQGQSGSIMELKTGHLPGYNNQNHNLSSHQQLGQVNSNNSSKHGASSTLGPGTHSSTIGSQPGWQQVRISQQCVQNLESELEASRNEYRNLMTELGERLKSEARKLGNCVEKARPLFDAQRSMRRMQSEVQSASISYKKAQNLKDAAKNMVTAAEYKVKDCEKIKTNGKDVGALMNWLEQLNQSNDNFQIASKTCAALASQHSKSAQEFRNLQAKVQNLEQTSAVKYLDQARPYFNLQLDLWSKAEQHGGVMVRLEASLAEAKAQLSGALQSMNNSNNTNNSQNASNSDFSDQSSRTTSGDSSNTRGNGNPHNNNNLPYLRDVDEDHGDHHGSNGSLNRASLNNSPLNQRGPGMGSGGYPHQLPKTALQALHNVSESTMRMLGHPDSIIPQHQHQISPHLQRNLDLPGSRHYDDSASVDGLEDIFKPSQLFPDGLSREPSQVGPPSTPGFRGRQFSFENYLNAGSSGKSPGGLSGQLSSSSSLQNSSNSNQNNLQSLNSNSNSNNNSNNLTNTNTTNFQTSPNPNTTNPDSSKVIAKLANLNLDTATNNPASVLESIGFYSDLNISKPKPDNQMFQNKKVADILSYSSSKVKRATNYNLVMIDGEDNSVVSGSNTASEVGEDGRNKEVDNQFDNLDLEFDEDF